MYLNGRAIPTQGYGLAELAGEIGVDGPLVLGPSLADGAISDFRIFDRAVTESEAQLLAQWPAIESALAMTTTELTAAGRSSLLTYFLFHEHEPFIRLIREQNTLNLEAQTIRRRAATTLVMQERADHTPRRTCSTAAPTTRNGSLSSAIPPRFFLPCPRRCPEIGSGSHNGSLPRSTRSLRAWR